MPSMGASSDTSRAYGGIPVPLPRTRPSSRRLTYRPCCDLALDTESCSSNQSAQPFRRRGLASHLATSQAQLHGSLRYAIATMPPTTELA